MKNRIFFSLCIIIWSYGLLAQADTTINGVTYTLFSPGLWIETEGEGNSWSVGYVHCNPSNITELVDVINPVTGETWMDRNLGANRAAESSTDQQAYGSFFQWGRFADGHQCIHRYTGDGVVTSGTTATLSESDQPGHADFITSDSSPFDWRSPQNNNLWEGVNGDNNPCPNEYRLPTEAELNAERTSWSTNDAAGAFASPLKFTMGGFRFYSDGVVSYVDMLGAYWSSTVSGNVSLGLYFGSSDAFTDIGNRAYGVSVRCIKD